MLRPLPNHGTLRLPNDDDDDDDDDDDNDDDDDDDDDNYCRKSEILHSCGIWPLSHAMLARPA